jgi:hypothetical protein
MRNSGAKTMLMSSCPGFDPVNCSPRRRQREKRLNHRTNIRLTENILRSVETNQVGGSGFPGSGKVPLGQKRSRSAYRRQEADYANRIYAVFDRIRSNAIA